MAEEQKDNTGEIVKGWLEGHTPASLPYIIGFSIYLPVILAANIGLEFWLSTGVPWAANVRQGLLNAGTMSTWGIPLTIILTEWTTRMLARHYIAKREKEAKERYSELVEDLEDTRRQQENTRQEQENTRRQQEAWHEEQLALWEERKAQAEAEGREFDELPPVAPPATNGDRPGRK